MEKNKFNEVIRTDKERQIKRFFSSDVWSSDINYRDVILHLLSDNDIDNDFAQLREYFKKIYNSSSAPDLYLWKIEFTKDREKVLNEILEWKDFKTPKELVTTIADYILKNNVSYDPLIFLNKISELINSIRQSNVFLESWLIIWLQVWLATKAYMIMNIFEEQWIIISAPEKSRLLEAKNNEELEQIARTIISRYYHQGANLMHYKEYHLSLFDTIFKELLNNEIEIPSTYKDYIKELTSFIEKKESIWFWRYFSSKILTDENFREFFSDIIHKYWYDEILSIWKYEQVIEILEEAKLWCCVHFSILMKEIFNAIISWWRWYSFSDNAKMFYVINGEHAYNVLYYEITKGKAKWAVIKTYIDLTNFISTKGELFFHPKKQEEELII